MRTPPPRTDRRPAQRASRHARALSAFALLAALASAPTAAQGTLDCQLEFNLAGWSVFYKTASGSGTVSCNDGQRLAVKIESRGGGLSFGKSRIDNGVGEFSGVGRIEDVLGTYAAAEAHAGAGRSSKAQVVTNGDISLALAGTGQGWDVGVAFGKFTISR
ncbi:hypothetical protein [Lysobacter sp. A3-1-A15]|uniref:hypothetical protein n=1 Tax=Novilysobacter viscosus TaxID=3098602 RepID=UPI002EDA5430